MALLGLGRHDRGVGGAKPILVHAGSPRLFSLGALVALTVVIPLTSGPGCVLDQAQVAFIPPASARVVATYTCGTLTCWERWIDRSGQRLGHGRACEAEAGDKITTPPRAPTVDPG